MTDEDKNVKNRICVVHLHFNSCFFCKLLGLQGCVCIFVCLYHPLTVFFFFPIKSYGGAEKSLRL